MAEDRQALKRIVRLLLSLADLAEQASRRPMPVLCLVLWILRPAEAIARRFVVERWRPSAMPALPYDRMAPSEDQRADALRLAAALRMLAIVLESLAAAGTPPCRLPPPRRRDAFCFLAGIPGFAGHAPEGADTS